MKLRRRNHAVPGDGAGRLGPYRKARPYLPIAVEEFEVRSIDELSSALKFKSDIFSFLQALGSQSMLLIDRLDALRGEVSQHSFSRPHSPCLTRGAAVFGYCIGTHF